MHQDLLQQIVLLLAVAVVAVVIFRRFHLPPILAYLSVGVLIGPHGLKLIEDSSDTRFLAEFGVVFLLFTVGLEFSLRQLKAMKNIVIGLGGAQVIISLLFFGGIGWLMGLRTDSAIILGGILALSSTAIVIKQLNEQLELNSRHGRLALGILIFQDLAVIPLLILINLMSQDSGGSFMQSVLLALFKGVLAFVILLAIGHWFLRPLFRLIARAHSSELFILTVLLVSLAAASLTDAAGLSLALGGFLAGAMLGETEFRHQIESDIKPFRDVLLGLFFITIGMLLNIHGLPAIWHWLALTVTVYVLFKLGLVYLLARLAHHEPGVSFRTGLVLAQGGEFGFALLSLALTGKLFDDQTGQILLATMFISMAIAPLLIRYNGVLAKRLFASSYLANRAEQEEMIASRTEGLQDHVIICGYGRIGQNISRFLDQEGFDYVALDLDPVITREANEAGDPVFYGDATHRENLKAAGLMHARVLVISFDAPKAAVRILAETRALRPDIPILVRTRDDTWLDALQEQGATEVVPETLEASLMLASHLLFLLDVPVSNIIRYVRNVREDRYRLLRGFFHGDEALPLDGEHPGREGLHAVTLQKGSKAIGKTLNELDLESHHITVTALRRGEEKNTAPRHDIILQENDVLVLYGTPEDIEHAESLLL